MITHDPASPVGRGGNLPGLPLVEPMPTTLLDEPLAYLFADHFRQRTVCTALRRMASKGRADRREAGSIVDFLRHDVPLHHEDEEKDLFPAVRRRALPEDRLGGILARLGQDHRRAVPLIDRIVGAFSLHDDPAIAIDMAASDAIQLYVDLENAHVAMENGIVLALARVRLTPDDLKAISRAMKARRGMAS